jgi:hypothetical protein
MFDGMTSSGGEFKNKLGRADTRTSGEKYSSGSRFDPNTEETGIGGSWQALCSLRAQESPSMRTVQLRLIKSIPRKKLIHFANSVMSKNKMHLPRKW